MKRIEPLWFCYGMYDWIQWGLMNEMNENILGKSDCLKEYLRDTSKGNY